MLSRTVIINTISPGRGPHFRLVQNRPFDGAGRVLRGDPAHKIVNPVLYRYEEASACWRQVRAPVLWIDGAESAAPKRLGLDAAQLAERRSAFVNLRHVAVPGAGHMLHHDEPEAVANLIDEFLAS